MKQSVFLKYDCLDQVDELISGLRRDLYARGDIADGTKDDSGKNFRIYLKSFTEVLAYAWPKTI